MDTHICTYELDKTRTWICLNRYNDGFILFFLWFMMSYNIFSCGRLAPLAIERNIMYLRYSLLLMCLSFFYIATPIRRKAFKQRRKRLFKRTRFKAWGTVYTNVISILCIVFLLLVILHPEKEAVCNNLFSTLRTVNVWVGSITKQFASWTIN